MSDIEDDREDAFAALRQRADALERELLETRSHAATQLRQADLKAAALQAGIIDIDGLRLLDSAIISGSEDEVFHASDVIARLRQDKPWLFGKGNSSNPGEPPAVALPKRRHATEMTVDEWRTARAALLRRR